MENCVKCCKLFRTFVGKSERRNEEDVTKFARYVTYKVGFTYRVNSITAGRITSCFYR